LFGDRLCGTAGQRRARNERRTFDAGMIPEFGAVDLRFLTSLASGHQH
jgi:hypothetical protein